MLTKREVALLKAKRCSMIHRCDPNNTEPKNRSYREKGITVCDEWIQSPDAFLKFAEENGYKEGLTIDRINSSKGYFPENCRFVPMSKQPLNTDRNVFIEVDGEVITQSEMARRCGISPEGVRKRIKLGWYKVVDNPSTVETLVQ